MKKLLCSALAAAIALSLIPAAHAEPLKDGDISISAPCAILMEKETGEVLYEKAAHERRFPASVTKVMTMLLITEAVESGKISLNDTVTASERAASFGGSCVYLEEGEKMSVSEMLKCIAVVSANDCAVAMAEHLCGTEELFVEKMNERAKELGLENTHFTGCTGLIDDGEHYTTAYDIAVMSRELIKHDMIKEYTTIWMDSIRNGEFGLSNTNKLVYWYPGCTGLKTGYTSSAMYCLSATAERDGIEFIAVILHGDTIDSRNNDAKTLLNYGFSSFALCPLKPEMDYGCVEVELGRENTVSAVPGGEEYALVQKSGAVPEYAVTLPEKLSAPIHKGDEIGTMSVTVNGSVIASVPLLAAGSVERIGYGGIWTMLFKSLFGV